MTNPPLPARPVRHDGWTILRQQIFLETLAATATVTAGAEAAGMTVSSAYRFRRSPAGKGFRAGWDAAMEVGGQRLGDYAIDKAVRGFARPVYDRDGKLHHVDTRHDGRLLMFMLERLDRARFGYVTYEQRDRANSAGDRFADALDALDAAAAAEAGGVADGDGTGAGAAAAIAGPATGLPAVNGGRSGAQVAIAGPATASRAVNGRFRAAAVIAGPGRDAGAAAAIAGAGEVAVHECPSPHRAMTPDTVNFVNFVKPA